MSDLSERHRRILRHYREGRKCFSVIPAESSGLDRTIWVGRHPAYRVVMVPRRPSVDLFDPGDRPLMANLDGKTGVRLVDLWVRGNRELLTSYAQLAIDPAELHRRLWWIDRDNPPITDFSGFRPWRVVCADRAARQQKSDRIMQAHYARPGSGVEVSLWSCDLYDKPRPWRLYRSPMEWRGLWPDSVYRLMVRQGEHADGGPYESVYADVDGIALLDRSATVESFARAVSEFPVLVRVDPDDYHGYRRAAVARGITCRGFLGGIGFRSSEEAMLVKLAA